MRSPPKITLIQLRDEERPYGEANPSKSTVHPNKENRMNHYILPIVGIAAIAAIAIGAMLTETPLSLKISKYLDLRVGLSTSQTDK